MDTYKFIITFCGFSCGFDKRVQPSYQPSLTAPVRGPTGASRCFSRCSNDFPCRYGTGTGTIDPWDPWIQSIDGSGVRSAGACNPACYCYDVATGTVAATGS